uniref:CCHC-type domain-containing protein n=1 Tax=Arundo donax TaxID=35708 RepID=A0A0A8XNG9_ARUDO
MGNSPFRNKGMWRIVKQGHKGGSSRSKQKNGSKPNGKGKALKGPKGDANDVEHSNKGCWHCGSMKHWSRSCNIEPHLIELYQEWKSNQNLEDHFVQAPVDAMIGAHLPEPT